MEVTWLMQGAKLEPVNEVALRYRLSKGQAQCEFQLVADAPLKAKIGVSTANDHSKPLGWQQLQAGDPERRCGLPACSTLGTSI